MFADKAWMLGGIKTKNADQDCFAWIGITGLFLDIQAGQGQGAGWKKIGFTNFWEEL